MKTTKYNFFGVAALTVVFAGCQDDIVSEEQYITRKQKVIFNDFNVEQQRGQLRKATKGVLVDHKKRFTEPQKLLFRTAIESRSSSRLNVTGQGVASERKELHNRSHEGKLDINAGEDYAARSARFGAS